MKHNTRFVLLVLVLWSAHLAKAQQEGDGDVVSADAPEDDEQNGTDQSNGNRVGRIVGGVPATSANQPYAAVININDGSIPTPMVGAIISNTEVLTSASAIKKIRTINLERVYLSDTNSWFTEAGRDMKSYELHKDFDSTSLANDVAIITIDGTFVNFAGQKVQPIAIATTAIAVSATNRTKCVVLGYGQNPDGTQNFRVNQVDYELMTDQECAATGANPPSIMCAKPAGTSYACKLDSGAPLVCNGQLYGILTDQSSCSTTNPPKYQKFAKLPVIKIPWNTASTSASNATVPTAPRKNYVSCP